MPKPDGRAVAQQSDLRVLKALHKFGGFLRTRDIAVLIFMRAKIKRPTDFLPVSIVVDGTAWRMAQRSLARLRRDNRVIWAEAPDGSLIYGLSEVGARLLLNLGISAKSTKSSLRRVSLAHYHHRRLANEVAITAALMGYRVNSEHEIASGLWFGGSTGVMGKFPDSVVRDGTDTWLIEIEKSRKNGKDFTDLVLWLRDLYRPTGQTMNPLFLPGGQRLRKILFVCEGAFIDKLKSNLLALGWTDEMLDHRIGFLRLLYVTQAKFICKKSKPIVGAAELTSIA